MDLRRVVSQIEKQYGDLMCSVEKRKGHFAVQK